MRWRLGYEGKDTEGSLHERMKMMRPPQTKIKLKQRQKRVSLAASF